MSISAIEYRSVIKFLLLRGKSRTEIMEELSAAYKTQCPSRSTVYYWIGEFNRGRQDVMQDFSQVGRPLEISSTKVDECERLLREHRRITIREVASALKISYGSVQTAIHQLGYSKVCSRFVPKFLSPEMKEVRLECARENLQLYNQYGDAFLRNIVTADETPLSLYVPESKRESSEWKRSDERAPIKMRSGTSHPRELMLTVFWDSHGVIHADYLEKGKTINGIYYADLVSETRKKRRKQKNVPLWILHDNAPIHKCAVAVQEVNDSGFKLLPHPPYSPDVAPSDFYLFQRLKKSLRGKVFDSRDELKCFVSDWFSALPSSFFSAAFDELLVRWHKMVDANGSYIEK